MAEKDQLRGEELDERAAELNIEGRSGMTADEKRAAIEEAGGGPQDQQSSAQRSDALADAGPPEGQQAAPERDPFQPLQVVDSRARVEAKDRNMYVGLVHKIDRDADVSGDYVDINGLDRDEPTEVGGTPVEDAQVIGGSSGLVLILNGQAFHLGDIAGGVLGDLQHAALVKRNS